MQLFSAGTVRAIQVDLYPNEVAHAWQLLSPSFPVGASERCTTGKQV
jgi:hypothetical protein